MARPYSLTDRQVRILELLADGKGTREICAELYISNATFKVHLRRIGAQMGMVERAGIVGEAYRCGVLRVPDAELMRQALAVQQQARQRQAAAMRGTVA